MAPKQLPPAKISPAKLLGGSSLATTVKKISAKSIAGGDRSFELGVIKKQVIKISDLVKTNTLLKAKEEDRKRKLAEQKRFGEKEEKLEKPKEKQDKIPSFPALPKLGFLDRIKSFLFNIFLGYISLRLLPYLPKLAGIVGTIVKVQDTIINISGKILNGLVSFVDKAYEVHDKTRKFLGDLGGDNFTKTFDGFIDAMDKVILASIAGAIAFGELRDTGGEPDVAAAARGGKYARSGVTNLARKGVVATLGRGGTKTALKIVKPLVKRIPLIGGIMEFVLSWMSGDPVGKAAFKGIGGGLGTWIGGALGSLIPIPGVGTAIGMYLGAEGGSALGGLLYDKIFNNKDPKQQKVQGRAGGGSVTRGGQLTGPIKRTLKKPKVTRTIKVQTTEVKPGQSVGGEDKIKKIFPETETKDADTVNPLGYMKSSYKIGSSVPGFGGIAAIFMKAQLGEQPSNVDYQNAADGLSSWMQRTFGGGIQRTGGAFAGGGEVDAGMFGNSDDMKNVIAKALQNSVAPKVEDIINDLKKQIGLKEIDRGKKPGEGPGAEDEPTGSPTLVGDTNAEKVFRYLVDTEGFTPEAAAGIIGNLMQESGVNPKSKQLGGGPGRGIMQWTESERWASLTAWANNSGKDPWALETQVEWMVKEMKSYGTYNRIKGVSSYKRAVEIFEREMERAGTPNYPRRYQFAADALASFSSGAGAGVDIPLGKGYGTAGGKIAGELGRYIKQKLKQGPDFQAVTEHPEHGGVGPPGVHARNSYHYKGRAIDIGAYSNEQAKILKVIAEFNRIKGVQPIQLLHAKNEPSGHSDHVHVAYKRGGKVKGKRGIDQIRAMLTHGEYVLDLDSTTALEKNFPGFLDALNKANYDGAIKVLRSYAEYEQGSTIHAVVDEKLIPVPIPISSPQQPVVISSGFGESEDSMSFNYTR